jgi:glycosyltransferase involved in cell wall biosynthesis
LTTRDPRVSVVIPNYNYARYLEERFGSILSQSFRDYEIIFIDDASQDESVALVREKFAERVTRIETSTVNSGNPFTQWNRGVRLARGEFVWIAEADDTCAPAFLARLVEALDRSPRIGLAYCYTTPVDETGSVLDAAYYRRYVEELDGARWRSDFVADGRTEVRNYLSRKNTITNVSGVVFRREAYVGMGYAPEHMRMCGDWLAYCRLLHDWDVAFVAQPMNFHRQHAAKHTQNAVLNLTYFREFLQVQQYLAEAFDLGPAERAAAFRRFMGEWDRLTVSNYGRIGVRNTLALARMSAARYRRADERVRIVAHFLLNATKSLASAWKES